MAVSQISALRAVSGAKGATGGKALRGGLGEPLAAVVHTANPEPDDAIRRACAQTGGRLLSKPGPVGLGERRCRSPTLSVDE